MKNYINYFYEFNVENLSFFNEKYFFTVDGNEYIFKQCYNSDLNIYYNELAQQLASFRFFSNFILNKYGNLVTLIDNIPYILLKISKYLDINKKIQLLDIRTNMFIKLDDKLVDLMRFPWIGFWEKKIDYLENWIINKKDLYKNKYAIFNFFIGLSENALLYLKETIRSERNSDNTDELAVQHFRLDCDTYLYDYYDPSNIIFDHSSRDVTEFIKSLWKKELFDYELFEKYLDNLHVSKFWIRIMYSRLLFPSFFFDYMEECIIKNKNNDLSYLETKIDDFQIFLEKVSILLWKKYKIKCLKWIIKSY